MRFIWSCTLLAALLGPLLGAVAGCGGVTETQKQEAEKIPDLDISESDAAEDGADPQDKETSGDEAP